MEREQLVTSLWHRLLHGHPTKPWAIDLDGNPIGCSTCLKERIMRAIRRQPDQWPRRGW